MRTLALRLLIAVGGLGIGVVDAAAGTATKVAAGGNHTCVLTAAGGVVCWGRNAYGQLGDGTTTDRLTPRAVLGLDSGIADIAAGYAHTCALTIAGGVVCWGGNGAGSLGDGTTTSRLTPTPVSGLGSGVWQIAVGGAHTCALTMGGGVWCWGYNYYGQLGDMTTTDRLVPTPVFSLDTGVATVAAGGYHTCALTTGGGVLCWGRNWEGQVGDGTTTYHLTPTSAFALGSGVVAISTGGLHTCAVSSTVGVLCWGLNSFGQLGDGTTTYHPTPTSVSGLGGGVAKVAAGQAHTCSLRALGGDMLCWGDNIVGQLGDGTITERLTPRPVLGLGWGVVAIAAGSNHTCALTATGGVLCWGNNIYGQLGDGTTADRFSPTPVVGLGGATVYSDFTGDLESDILWRHATGGDVWLWPMDGAVRTSERYVRTVAEPGWEIRGLGDPTGDGKADILWRHAPTGMLFLWTMNGLTVLAETYLGTVDPAYDIVGTGDYDGDGRSDILWRQLTNGELWVWLMDGATVVSATYVTTVAPGYAVVGSGDLNGDAKADIVWRGTGGDVWVWLMNGATPTAMTYVTTVGELGYQIVGVADHTGDGKADILWWHATRGEVWVWTMNGASLVSQSYVGMAPDTGYRIVGNGDYNGDGKADILWHHATRGEVWVWLMNGVVKLSENYVGSVPDVGYQIVKTK